MKFCTGSLPPFIHVVSEKRRWFRIFCIVWCSDKVRIYYLQVGIPMIYNIDSACGDEPQGKT